MTRLTVSCRVVSDKVKSLRAYPEPNLYAV